MPELPEVEIVRQSLNKKIKQKKVKKVVIRNRNLRIKMPLNFASLLKNQRILKVERFSKYLILALSNNGYCLIHLGMSGTVHIINFNKNHKDIMSTQTFDNEILFCQANTSSEGVTFIEIEKKLIMIETIKLLDGSVWDKNELIKNMDNDEFYYKLCGQNMLSSSVAKHLLDSYKKYYYTYNKD